MRLLFSASRRRRLALATTFSAPLRGLDPQSLRFCTADVGELARLSVLAGPVPHVGVAESGSRALGSRATAATFRSGATWTLLAALAFALRCLERLEDLLLVQVALELANGFLRRRVDRRGALDAGIRPIMCRIVIPTISGRRSR